MVDWRATMGKARISEWLWRFMAGVMVFAVGWTLWILYQLNPPPLVTNAAYEAAANANAKQNAQGVIAPAPAPAAAPVQEAPKGEKPPPINADRLKLSDSISLPATK
jgi:hypothetical protein